MKALLALLLLLLTGGLIYNYHTSTHPIYSRETYLFRDRLSELASEINNSNLSWKAGHNSKFDSMGVDAIKGLMGVLEEPAPKTFPVKDITPINDLPDNFKPQDKWPKCESVTEIRDQSNCGSCWAFGAVEAMSDRWCIHSNQEKQDRISAEDLTTCCSSCGFGCNGGWPSMAWDYYTETGIVTGDLYQDTKWCSPYTLKPCDHHTSGPHGPCPDVGPTPACTKQCQQAYTTPYQRDKHHGKDVYSVPSNVEKIKTELYTNGPIEVAFTVYEDFLTYKTGVYEHKTGSALGGHAVKMVGWGVEDNTPYWLVANSWNESWGDKGYFKIISGKDHCGIESQGVAGIPKYD